VRIYVGGLALRGDGYPVAARTVALLQQIAGIEVIHCGDWLPDDLHLWKLAHVRRLRALRWLCVLVFGNLGSLVRACRQTRRLSGPVYVPYPSIFFLFWSSFVPARWRPSCIADAYLSIWDSMFQDRNTAASGSLGSKVLHWVEGRALRAAAVVLVDTEGNRDFLAREFALDRERIRSLPLAIEQEPFLQQRAKPPNSAGKIRVLFVGTLIPLHGIATILEAIRILRDDVRFEFRLVGDGQESGLVRRFVQEHVAANLTWISEWQSLAQIAEEIAEAHVCLGVFGGEAKAARVLPFKVYMYLAAGRPVVSQAAYSVPHDVPAAPIDKVCAGDGTALAEAIVKLASDTELQERIAGASARFFDDWLANACVERRWVDEVLPLARSYARGAVH
jgi:glycosyltransferase involved in cell wall biosynthesis